MRKINKAIGLLLAVCMLVPFAPITGGNNQPFVVVYSRFKFFTSMIFFINYSFSYPKSITLFLSYINHSPTYNSMHRIFDIYRIRYISNISKISIFFNNIFFFLNNKKNPYILWYFNKSNFYSATLCHR